MDSFYSKYLTMSAFKNAFRGKTDTLAQKLDVTDKLLRKLIDKRIIEDEHFSDIKEVKAKSRRVDKLLEALERRDDSLFSKFCDVLTEEGQGHVAKELRRTDDALCETRTEGNTGTRF